MDAVDGFGIAEAAEVEAAAAEVEVGAGSRLAIDFDNAVAAAGSRIEHFGASELGHDSGALFVSSVGVAVEKVVGIVAFVGLEEIVGIAKFVEQRVEVVINAVD